MIKIKENVNDVQEFNHLYKEVGWRVFPDEISRKALANTFYSVSVYNGDEIIGYGRIIGDSICFLYIHSVMVAPLYQNKKVGTLIMKKLLKKVAEVKKENPNLKVYLGSLKGKEDFYKKFGFVARSETDLGEAMVLKDRV